ncbi:uncharacterized protein METZ01_LOCUS329956 [marine metagenome]|uniref:Uncharacterized protein n=1 Tax=marine metagenome TaxID=408172 RepID=A0A382PYD5_9ZZZZ
MHPLWDVTLRRAHCQTVTFTDGIKDHKVTHCLRYAQTARYGDGIIHTFSVTRA